MVEEASLAADQAVADALFELESLEESGDAQRIHYARFEGLRRVATSLTRLHERLFDQRLQDEYDRGWASD